MNEKVCNKCCKSLPLSDFQKHSNRPGGHSVTCKVCTSADRKKQRAINNLNPEWVEKESERRRERTAVLKLNPAWVLNRRRITRECVRRMKGKYKGPTREQHKRTVEKYTTRFPEKVAAAIACQHFPKSDGMRNHHWSYNEDHRKDVIILTAVQHYLVHRHMTYDQERMMYRRLDGTLIDSREAAIAYYATLKD